MALEKLLKLASFPKIEKVSILNKVSRYSIRCKDGMLVLGKTKEAVLREYLTAEGIKWR